MRLDQTPEVRAGAAALTAGGTHAGGDAQHHRPRTTPVAEQSGVRGLCPRTFRAKRRTYPVAKAQLSLRAAARAAAADARVGVALFHLERVTAAAGGGGVRVVDRAARRRPLPRPSAA